MHFKVLKLGQILCVDKTGFLRLGNVQVINKGLWSSYICTYVHNCLAYTE